MSRWRSCRKGPPGPRRHRRAAPCAAVRRAGRPFSGRAPRTRLEARTGRRAEEGRHVHRPPFTGHRRGTAHGRYDRRDPPARPTGPPGGPVGALPAVPDLAVLAVPAASVPEAAQECGRAGVRALVVLASGLTAGEARRLMGSCRRYSMRLTGPNSLGLAQTDLAVRLDAEFGAALPLPGTAGVAVPSASMPGAGWSPAPPSTPTCGGSVARRPPRRRDHPWHVRRARGSRARRRSGSPGERRSSASALARSPTTCAPPSGPRRGSLTPSAAGAVPVAVVPHG